MRTMLRSLLATVALSVAAASAVAAYPDRPVILVNPYAAGGPADVVARSLARALETVSYTHLTLPTILLV